MGWLNNSWSSILTSEFRAFCSAIRLHRLASLTIGESLIEPSCLSSSSTSSRRLLASVSRWRITLGRSFSAANCFSISANFASTATRLAFSLSSICCISSREFFSETFSMTWGDCFLSRSSSLRSAFSLAGAVSRAF